MTLAILTLLGALVPFGIWLWKRRAARQEDPTTQHQQAYDDADTPPQKPGVALSDSLDRLDELDRLHPPPDRHQ